MIPLASVVEAVTVVVAEVVFEPVCLVWENNQGLCCKSYNQASIIARFTHKQASQELEGTRVTSNLLLRFEFL